MDLSIRSETFVQDSQKWLASKHGVDTAQGVTLDASKFSGMYPNDFIPSGTVVAKYADGKVGPYNPAASDASATAIGILLEAVPVHSGTSTPSAALLKHCFVNADKMPFGTGATTKGAFDSAAQADLTHVVVR
jgi:hypothetical protein